MVRTTRRRWNGIKVQTFIFSLSDLSFSFSFTFSFTLYCRSQPQQQLPAFKLDREGVYIARDFSNMLRSKSRSASFDLGRKNHASVLSRTISASKFCRGDPVISQIHKNALKPIEPNPSMLADLSQKQVVGISTMQGHSHSDQNGEELKISKEKLAAMQEERGRLLNELRETKMVAQEANTKLSEALSSQQAAGANAEFDAVKESLSNSTRELKMKKENIESLKLELDKAKEIELRLKERDASCHRLEEELSNAKASQARAMGLLSESQRRIQELEDELQREKLSENKISRDHDGGCGHEDVESMKETIENLRFELQLAKENLARVHGGDKIALSKAQSPVDEVNSLKSELKSAIEAEETSKKAMDDLALALKEVATEANTVKEKLATTETELEHVKQEAAELKGMVRSIEEGYEKKLEEAKKENERNQHTIQRLTLETEESLLAWNAKEMGFVECIKKADEEKAHVQQENARLIESQKAAENATRTSREENFKLRDILKQALNEANVAKEAAAIARAENSQLKDSLVEKDEALDFIIQENERLRINEAAAHESIKGLKRFLSASATKPETEQGSIFRFTKSMAMHHKDGRKLNKAFSFNLSELKAANRHDQDAAVEAVEEDPEKAEALKGSIFDTVESPKSEPNTPMHRGEESECTEEKKGVNVEEADHQSAEVSHFSDAESERSSQRNRRPLLRRFGDLIRRKTSYRKEQVVE
ncbi:putative WEB family protein At1g65010, chloroplastic [Diospyros lotus]|uniref:putative WEB family protein At1g65010, chloroplastic n=1 Tax=Diospyros lotus TaxID=55363 RepID=UPI00224F82C5|nr:putative WEB family protein At1g65010, chloroplastic [Diospyros lotus]